MSADGDILGAVRAQFHSPPARLGVAVSGGGDSVALLHILSRCFDPGTVELHAATVDHGLRQEAADEARAVAALAEILDVPHSVLTWRDWDGAGNLQDQARRARYRLLGDWARARGIEQVALGHTADDQAETVLMRLARSSGVTGLSAIPARRTLHGVTFLRPMLGLERAALRAYLRRQGIAWAEDPSNDDDRFDRVRARKALQVLEPLGLTATGLAAVAGNMAQAREALDWYSFLAARELARIDAGAVVLDLRGFRVLPEEIARRLLVRAVMWISGADYPPRRSATATVLGALRRGRSATLGGCRVLSAQGAIWICREYNAVRALSLPAGATWDGRWQLYGDSAADIELRALGRRGLRHCQDWRDSGRPLAALAATPAVWSGDDLVAAPLAGLCNGWRAELIGGDEAFFTTLLSH